MAAPRLTTPSYLVLGLVEFAEPVTPYQLKRLAEISVQNFWSLPHTQIYAQCDRLAKAGLLSEKREASGRRRRVFSTTAAGRKALAKWREETCETRLELRDTGLLKLFFGADQHALAERQIASHTAQLDEYESLAARVNGMPDGMRRALEAGILFEREIIGFWRQIATGRPVLRKR